MLFPATTSRALVSIPNSPTTTASLNSAIRSFLGRGLHFQTLLLYIRSLRAGLRPDHLTFPFLLKSLSNLPAHPLLPQSLHAHLLKSPFSPDPFSRTALVNLYAKSQRPADAQNAFDEMPQRDVVAWNAVVSGHTRSGNLTRLLTLFRRMRLEDVRPDAVTVISLTQCSARRGDLPLVRASHCFGLRIGLSGEVSVANTWVAAYSKLGELASAKAAFGEIPTGSRSVVSWNAMISGCAFVGLFDEVGSFFRGMNAENVRPDLSTVLSLLSMFGQLEAIGEGKMIHCLATKLGFSSDVAFVNTLISLYSKCGDTEGARCCFDRMLVRTCVSWTAMIGGYAKKGDVYEAMLLFGSMEASGVKPDAFAVVAVLSACSQAGNLELGKSIGRYVVSNGFEQDVVVCNALVDMYSKCGSIEYARSLFDSMLARNVVTWTAMIAGYAMNGHFREALDLFREMLRLQFSPNQVTFLAVIQACTHGGLLEEGQEHFESMRKVYLLEPKLEHYACMVDLFGRRGRIDDALEFIGRMPVDPDAGVWGALLGACITHKETKVGEYAASRLFELEPRAAASYVGMANIYAARERWEGVARMRAMMKRERVNKCPGQSIVQVDGKGHTFTVEDRIHPEGLMIYEVLDCLALHLKETFEGLEGFCVNS